jgi:hypothetical protein
MECPENTNTEFMLSCCSCALVQGDEPCSPPYQASSHVKGELHRRRAQRALKRSSEKTFFSKFTSPEQSYVAALRQDTQHQQPEAPQTCWE